MNIKVVDETVSSTTSRRVVLFAQGIMRTMAIGSNWSKLRVGAILSTTGTTAITGTPRLYFGLLQGTTAGVLSNETTNYLGIRTSDPEFGISPLHDCRVWDYIKKSGSTITVVQSLTPGAEIASVDAVEDYSNCIVIDFTKVNSTTISSTLWTQNVTSAHVHVNADKLANICNTEASPASVIGGTVAYTSTTFSNATGLDVTVYDSIEIATDFLRDFQIDAVAYGRLA